MCFHKWARQIDGHGHTIFNCTKCPQEVDYTAAREEYDRQRQQPDLTPIYDPTAGIVDTPLGPARYVLYDPVTSTVTVETESDRLVAFQAGACYVRREAV